MPPFKHVSRRCDTNRRPLLGHAFLAQLHARGTVGGDKYPEPSSLVARPVVRLGTPCSASLSARMIRKRHRAPCCIYLNQRSTPAGPPPPPGDHHVTMCRRPAPPTHRRTLSKLPLIATTTTRTDGVGRSGSTREGGGRGLTSASDVMARRGGERRLFPDVKHHRPRAAWRVDTCMRTCTRYVLAN